MKKLLAIIDVSNDFADENGVFGSEATEALVPGIIKYANQFDGEVIATQDTHGENYLETQEGKKLPIIHGILRSWGWELYPGIEPLVSRIIIKDRFGSIELAEYIRQGGYDQVEFCGLVTNICVAACIIVAKTFNPEVEMVLHKDLCAGTTPEMHDAAIKVLESLQVTIV